MLHSAHAVNKNPVILLLSSFFLLCRFSWLSNHTVLIICCRAASPARIGLRGCPHGRDANFPKSWHLFIRVTPSRSATARSIPADFRLYTVLLFSPYIRQVPRGAHKRRPPQAISAPVPGPAARKKKAGPAPGKPGLMVMLRCSHLDQTAASSSRVRLPATNTAEIRPKLATAAKGSGSTALAPDRPCRETAVGTQLQKLST